MDECKHAEQIRDVTPSALGCEECLKSGSEWVHLRLCRTCGHIGYCYDASLEIIRTWNGAFQACGFRGSEARET